MSQRLVESGFCGENGVLSIANHRVRCDINEISDYIYGPYGHYCEKLSGRDPSMSYLDSVASVLNLLHPNCDVKLWRRPGDIPEIKIGSDDIVVPGHGDSFAWAIKGCAFNVWLFGEFGYPVARCVSCHCGIRTRVPYASLEFSGLSNHKVTSASYCGVCIRYVGKFSVHEGLGVLVRYQDAISDCVVDYLVRHTWGGGESKSIKVMGTVDEDHVLRLFACHDDGLPLAKEFCYLDSMK